MTDKKLFGGLSVDGLEKTGDSLGGMGPVDSGVFNAKIKVAYATKSSGGANAVVLQCVLENGRDYNETLYVTNKNGENFYTKGDKKTPLPGFTTVNDLCLLATGASLMEQDSEEKMVKIWNYDSKADIPTKVPVLTDLVGKDITLAILKQTEDKQSKDDSGNYVNTGETRDVNVIDKVFHSETRKTVSEIIAKLETPVFLDAWAKKNTGNTRMRAKGGEGQSGAPAKATGTSGKPATKSLFG